MKKFVLSAVLMMAGLSLFAAGEKLLQFMPANVEGVLFVDAGRALGHPGIKDLRGSDREFDENWAKLEQELGKYQLKLGDLVKNAAMFLSEKDLSGLIIETGVDPKRFDRLVAAGFGRSKDYNLNFTREKIAGRDVYGIKTDNATREAIPGVIPDQDGVLTYLDASHVLIAPKNQFEKVIKAIGAAPLSGDRSFRQRLDELTPKAAAWVLFNLPPELTNPKTDDPNAMNPMAAYLANIVSGGFAVDFSGANAKDIDLSGFLRCKDDQSAQAQSQQLQMAMMLLTAGIGDPKLSAAVSKAIRISAQGKDVKLKVALTEALQNQLKAFSAAARTPNQAAAPSPLPDAAPVK